jgi:hypothetical protein
MKENKGKREKPTLAPPHSRHARWPVLLPPPFLSRARTTRISPSPHPLAWPICATGNPRRAPQPPAAQLPAVKAHPFCPLPGWPNCSPLSTDQRAALPPAHPCSQAAQHAHAPASRPTSPVPAPLARHCSCPSALERRRHACTARRLARPARARSPAHAPTMPHPSSTSRACMLAPRSSPAAPTIRSPSRAYDPLRKMHARLGVPSAALHVACWLCHGPHSSATQ